MACTGVGLHSGAPVSLRILPAPAGTGIVFHRTDLDSFAIEASGRNVARVSYATSLMKKGVLISTTEHLLSAFIGVGIDNAIVELDNLELPILDGSARPFVEMIQRAGIRRQRKARTYLRIMREIELREGDKFIAVYPANAYSVSYSINFPHPLIGKQSFCVRLTNGSYLKEIAPARTFGFLHEADAMRQQGLIRGASIENAIVLNRDEVLNPPLRFRWWPTAPAMPCIPRSCRAFCAIGRIGKKQHWNWKMKLRCRRSRPRPVLAPSVSRKCPQSVPVVTVAGRRTLFSRDLRPNT